MTLLSKIEECFYRLFKNTSIPVDVVVGLDDEEIKPPVLLINCRGSNEIIYNTGIYEVNIEFSLYTPYDGTQTSLDKHRDIADFVYQLISDDFVITQLNDIANQADLNLFIFGITTSGHEQNIRERRYNSIVRAEVVCVNKKIS